MRFVVLLRGINVGANNRIAMPALREALEAAGFANVRTLLQSGNVVLDSAGSAADVRTRLRGVLERDFGLGVDVVVRNKRQFAKVVHDNPLASVAQDGSKQFVAFCSEPPDRWKVPDLPGDEVVVRGKEIHVWCPHGLRDSKLMTAMGRTPPAAVTTVRNWNTVEKLAALLDD